MALITAAVDYTGSRRALKCSSLSKTWTFISHLNPIIFRSAALIIGLYQSNNCKSYLDDKCSRLSVKPSHHLESHLGPERMP